MLAVATVLELMSAEIFGWVNDQIVFAMLDGLVLRRPVVTMFSRDNSLYVGQYHIVVS